MEPLRLSTREGYDLWSAIYDGEDNPLIRLEARFLPPLLGEVRGLRIADVGCGTGRYALPLSEAGAQVVGLDFSAGMLERANRKRSRDRGSPLFLRAAVDALPLAPSLFDRVLCCLVLDHIIELDSFFGELARLLSEDGFLLCSVMHPAMNLQGIEARFTDASGREVRPASARNAISDYLMAAARAGLRFDHLSEHAVDQELCACSPRAGKHLGLPLLFLMRLRLASRLLAE